MIARLLVHAWIPRSFGAALALVCLVATISVQAELAGAVDSEQALVQRRAARLPALPEPPQPPEISAAVKHPIDRFIAAKWRELPEPPRVTVCDDATFLRRVYLDIVGVIPTLKDTNRFLAARSSADKRSRLVDELLARDDDYAAHWTVFWEDALASQDVLAQGGILTRGDYREWLLSSFRRNRPYDVMVAELIDPSMPGRKAAVTKDVLGVDFSIAYVRNENHTATLQTAANVGQVFLGTSMKCASCHDHFENDEWPQERFLAFAGLFAGDDLEKIRCELKSGQMIAARFPFDLEGASTAVPAELDDRLHLAAQMITDPGNPRFAKTIVNRLWKRYFGLGLFEPADDFRLDTPASHPELLDWLAYDFIAHGCDLKHTIRLILTSQTYQLRYDPALVDTFSASEAKSPRYYRSPGLRRLTAEQLIDSIRVATAGEIAPEQRTYLDSRSTALTRALGRPASRNEISTARPDDVAVVQSLELLNGEQLHELIYAATPPAEITRLDSRRLVDRLYRVVLSRPATTDEKNAGRVYVESAESPERAIGDLLWVLVCSPEFQYLQ